MIKVFSTQNPESYKIAKSLLDKKRIRYVGMEDYVSHMKFNVYKIFTSKEDAMKSLEVLNQTFEEKSTYLVNYGLWGYAMIFVLITIVIITFFMKE